MFSILFFTKDKYYKELTNVNSQGGEQMLGGSEKSNNLKPGYKELLNKDDPIDKMILKLAKKGELNVGVVWVKGESEETTDDYSYKKPIKNI